MDEWAVTIMHFDGDRVIRQWIGADNLGLFIQLGVVDNPWPGWLPSLLGRSGTRPGR